MEIECMFGRKRLFVPSEKNSAYRGYICVDQTLDIMSALRVLCFANVFHQTTKHDFRDDSPSEFYYNDGILTHSDFSEAAAEGVSVLDVTQKYWGTISMLEYRLGHCMTTVRENRTFLGVEKTICEMVASGSAFNNDNGVFLESDPSRKLWHSGSKGWGSRLGRGWPTALAVHIHAINEGVDVVFGSPDTLRCLHGATSANYWIGVMPVYVGSEGVEHQLHERGVSVHAVKWYLLSEPRTNPIYWNWDDVMAWQHRVDVMADEVEEKSSYTRENPKTFSGPTLHALNENMATHVAVERMLGSSSPLVVGQYTGLLEWRARDDIFKNNGSAY